MKKNGKGIAMVALLSVLASAVAVGCGGGGGGGGGGGDAENEHFNYPGNYETPELKIDGKGDESQWDDATTVTYGRNNAVTAKIYRGEKALFFLFDVKDNNLLTQGVTNDDAVTRGDSIEFYLDTKADGGLHPQNDDFQINLGIHGKTRIMQGAGSNWGTWNGLIDYEVSLDGSLNSENDGVTDKGYTVEAMVQYKDIQVEKDAEIGISFGHVDKWEAADSLTGGTYWDWFGWTYNGHYTEPQKPDNYIILKADGTLIARDDMAMPAALVGGTVTDSDGNPLAGATAKTILNGNEIVATTDEDGYFVFSEKLDSEGTYTVTVEKDGYLTGMLTYTRAELRAVKGGKVEKNLALIAKEGTITVTGTVKNIVNGAVGGATVRVKGLAGSVTADANGNFTLEEVPTQNLPVNNVIVNNNTVNKGGIILVVSKDGYGESETWIEPDTLEGAEETLALGDVNINLPYGNTGSFGLKTNLFAESTALISRTLTGVEFKFTGLRRLAGHVEFYLDTKDSAGNRDSDPTWWRFDLQGNGNLGGDFRGNPIPAGQTASDKGIQYRLIKNDDNGYEAYLYLPYSYLGISPSEIFGVSFGQWSDSANDWDGWGYDGFIDPALPQNYVRVGASNNLYKANTNETLVTFSGNVGVGGIKVTANGAETVSAADGSWSMSVPVTSAAITVTYSGYGYVTKTTTIEAGHFSESTTPWSENVTMQEQHVSISGTVTDKMTNSGIAGVTVAITGTEWTTTTDENGEYTLTGITTYEGITVTFSKGEDYAQASQTYTVEELAAQDTHTLDKILTPADNVVKITISGSVTDLNGAAQGVTVTVDGTSYTTQTDASGNWSIANVDGVDGRVTVSKNGYISETLELNESDITDNAIAFGNTFLIKEYGEFAKSQKTVNPGESNAGIMAGFAYSVTRSETELLFRFVGDKPFYTTPTAAENRVEFLLAAANGSDWAVNVRITSDGDLSGAGSEKVQGLSVKDANSSTPVIEFRIAYDDIGITKNDAIRISGGQWCSKDGAGDWNGMNLNGFVGTGWGDAVKIYVGADNVAANTLEGLTASTAALTEED